MGSTTGAVLAGLSVAAPSALLLSFSSRSSEDGLEDVSTMSDMIYRDTAAGVANPIYSHRQSFPLSPGSAWAAGTM